MITSIKNISVLLLSILICSTSGCLELFPDETIVFEGKIYEAYDRSKPLDSVLVEGCTRTLTFFPTSPTCDSETFTNSDGYFLLSFEADGLDGRGILYSKDGYRSLDTCLTLDNTLECFMEALPTVFYIYSQSYSTPLTYDSLVVDIKTQNKDTIVYYHTDSIESWQGDKKYYWTTNYDSIYDRSDSYTSITVADNSQVSIYARYFLKSEVKLSDYDTMFCSKGTSNRYRIIN